LKIQSKYKGKKKNFFFRFILLLQKRKNIQSYSKSEFGFEIELIEFKRIPLFGIIE